MAADNLLLVIANRSSGSFTTTIEALREELDSRQLAYELHEIEEVEEVDELLADVASRQYRAVAVFGGDGTVIRAAQKLLNSRVPLLVIPGGSANSLAKEIGTAASVGELLDAYASQAYVIRRLQVAEYNQEPMILDAHFGLFAETLEDTPRPLKNLIGQAAYAFTVLRKIASSQDAEQYELEVDGEKITASGYVCYVVNYGRPQILGASLIPPSRQGTLRLALLRRVNLWAVLRWWISWRLFRRQREDTVLMRRAETIVVRRPSAAFSVDDVPQSAPRHLRFGVSNHTIHVMTPSVRPHSLRSVWRLTQATIIRGLDHARRELLGTVSLRYSRVARHLYLGGQYGEQAIHLFRGWRVTGIVSMREFTPKPIEGIDILHLPTVDHTAPAIADLEKGVHFIQDRIERGESVYIHCRLGEGRGPTMAAAYLITTGMRPHDAISHLQQTRPHARPNKQQVAQLLRFAERHTAAS